MSENGNSMMVLRHKIVMVGDISVGKTSIITRFTENKFKESYDVTNFN
jgi:GTPase SAR1 family protein